MSDLNLRLAGQAAGGLAGAEFRATSLRFTALQTCERAQALEQEALGFLASHHIDDEPVTWQPPTVLLVGLSLPGPDPAQNTVRATGRIRRQARQAVPEERFTQLYLDEHRSLQQIAALTGFSRRVLTGLAKEYGIPLRNGPQDYKRRGTIERDWLIAQYVHRRRTLPGLARETGMSTANMARWAHTHHIPLRPRGGGSHDPALRVSDRAAKTPAVLRKALTSPYAWQRLDRHLAAIAHPTMRPKTLCPGRGGVATFTPAREARDHGTGRLMNMAAVGRPQHALFRPAHQ
ncbi:hypothetical protein ABT168_13735 [Streptomyces sp. NPDC001793]|uniref:hypothetical protein n=1 Tax=Streptomyces sp. NPDC001793 TaxID=3154657 RepID=UPI003329458A